MARGSPAAGPMTTASAGAVTYDRPMSGALEDATRGTFVLLTGLVGAVLGIVLPTLFTTAPDASSTAVAVLAMALAALLALGTRWVSLAALVQPVGAVAGDGPPPVLHGRVTDPVHHPIRPRAPGLA